MIDKKREELLEKIDKVRFALLVCSMVDDINIDINPEAKNILIEAKELCMQLNDLFEQLIQLNIEYGD